MKHGSTQLFPILMLGALAGLTFWLQSAIQPPEDTVAKITRHEPDATAENFEIRRLDEQGRLKFRLSGPLLVHYPDDDSTEISQPKLTTYRPASPPIKVEAGNARISADGETVYLWNDVKLIRTATADRPEMVATMPDLTAKPDTGDAFTHSAVEIRQGASWLTGVGGKLNNTTSTLEIQSQVRGHYLRPTPPEAQP